MVLLKMLPQATIIMPVCIESSDRLHNFYRTLDYLTHVFDFPMIIKEASDKAIAEKIIARLPKNARKNICYMFEKNSDPQAGFHKTRHINDMLKSVTTPITIMHDLDCIACKQMYDRAITESFLWDSCILGNRLFNIEVTPKIWKTFRESRFQKFSEFNCSAEDISTGFMGGIVFTKTDVYRKIGGENEQFKNWGPEDQEKVYRMQKLGFKVMRINGILYHQKHCFGENSRNNSNGKTIAAHELFETIKHMSIDELKGYYKLAW